MTVSSLPETALSRLVSRHYAFLDNVSRVVCYPLAMILYVLHVYRWQTDPKLALTGRAQVLWQEALVRGIPMKQLMLFGRPFEFYCARINGRTHYFNGLPIPPKLNANSYGWMDDKISLKNFLLRHEIPISRGDYVWSLKAARGVFAKLTKPVIVKPRRGSHGRHSVTHVNSEKELDEAYAIASQLCQCVVVEEHLIGSVYRATYINGRIVGILRGDPPRVTGDGVATIAELVAKKNATRPSRVGEFRIDAKCIEFLKRIGYVSESVIPRGVEIDLSEKIGLSYGGNAVEMMPETHPELLAVLKRAGDLLQAPVVGFDFIIPDATKSPAGQRWGIIEANAEPFIDLHHNPLEGTGVNVAALVWDLWK